MDEDEKRDKYLWDDFEEWAEKEGISDVDKFWECWCAAIDATYY